MIQLQSHEQLISKVLQTEAKLAGLFYVLAKALAITSLGWIKQGTQYIMSAACWVEHYETILVTNAHLL